MEQQYQPMLPSMSYLKKGADCELEALSRVLALALQGRVDQQSDQPEGTAK